jgi:hypothetical protein
MEINKRFAEARKKLEEESSTRMNFWDEILPSINRGIVIPIISNSFRIEQIFREDSEETTDDGEGFSFNEQLTAEWANSIGYPMHDKHILTRVVQYYLIEQNDNPLARTQYLEFLKKFLLILAGSEPEYTDLAKRLKDQVMELPFSEIVHQLDYPRFPKNTEDPLRLLARFPLPIYITTSQSDFLERALEAEGKKPHTQICFWSGEISAKPEHRANPGFTPTIPDPLVYHLYGLEDYPQTLVLSEDDYINYLISLAEDTNTLEPIVPLSIRRALIESHLILIGYQLPDWDFRVLFRLIQKFRKDKFSPRGMVIQLIKDVKKIGQVDKSLEYLGQYFNRSDFDIEWKNAEAFIQKLWSNWNAYRQGQS